MGHKWVKWVMNYKIGKSYKIKDNKEECLNGWFMDYYKKTYIVIKRFNKDKKFFIIITYDDKEWSLEEKELNIIIKFIPLQINKKYFDL